MSNQYSCDLSLALIWNIRRASKITPPQWYMVGRGDRTPPWLFAMFQYFGEILPLVESRWFAPQDEVYIMCRSAAGGMEKLKT